MNKKPFAVVLSIMLILGMVMINGETTKADPSAGADLSAEYDGFPKEDITEEFVESKADLKASDLCEIEDGVFVEKSSGLGDNAFTACSNNVWDKYSTNVIYNQLSDEEKSAWRGFESICNDILNNTSDKKEYTYNIYSAKLSSRDLVDVADRFLLSNPQYYFVFSIVYSDLPVPYAKSMVCFKLYDKFQTGSERKAAQDSINSKLANWQSQINACPDEYSKVKKIHDLITSNVKYNHIFDKHYTNYEEQVQFTNSAYSVFCMNTAQYNGYAKAFAWLCNGSNINCFCIATSLNSVNHKYNKVRINDCWYNVDCAKDDLDGSNNQVCGYYYFCRSDAKYPNYAMTYIDKNLYPPCTLDTGSTWSAAGKLPAVTTKTATPTVTKTKKDGKLYISLSCATSGARIYYSTDGTTPSVSTTKCSKYTGTFEIKAGTTLKVIAVCDKNRDSDIQTYNIKDGIDDTTNGLAKAPDGNWYYYNRGVVQTSCNDLKQNNVGWWLVQSGKVRFDYTGIAKNNVGEWYISNGKVDFSKSGLVKVPANTSYYGTTATKYDGWYNFQGGKLAKAVALVKNSQGWWYVGADGKIDFSISTVAKNNVGWWVVQKGKVNFSYNGIASNQYGDWYCLSGKVQFNTNGLYSTPTGWYFLQGGKVRKNVESVERYGSNWWYVGTDGKIDFKKNTVAKNSQGWWAVRNGKVDFGFNGIADNANGSWYCIKGKVDFSYSGNYFDANTNKNYTIKNGKVV